MDAVIDNLDLFWSGYLRSLGICLWAMVGSLALGTLIATFRVSPVASLRGFGAAWVTVIRNCPLTVILFLFAFGLPDVGINQSYYVFGVSALVVYTSAFVCEAIRSGINAVSAGQAEAARAVGLTFSQSLTNVILPQAFRTSVPPLGSVIIAMFKNSAVVGAFGVGRDLFSVGKNLSSAQGYDALPVLTGVAIAYLCITLPAGAILAVLEREGGDRPVSVDAVLYDAPGPKARRRALIGTVVASLLLLGLVGLAGKRLNDNGQFDMELWGPLIDPSNESFSAVWRLIGRGLAATLIAAVLAITLSLILGTVLGTARIMLGRTSRIPIVGFIELFRGLPVVITIFYVWQVLPEVGIDVSPLPGENGLWYVVIGLTLYNNVIIAEILRAGIASLPRGQGEAARAIGMTEGQVMRTVLLPQAFRVMLPALISQLVVILKDTSLAAILGLYIELLRRANLIAGNLDNPLQTLTVVGAIYILLNYGLSRLAVLAERRLSRTTSSPALVSVASENAA